MAEYENILMLAVVLAIIAIILYVVWVASFQPFGIEIIIEECSMYSNMTCEREILKWWF